MTASTSIVLPELEQKLLHMWNKFLNRSDLTIDDDFFESGGDSLLAEQLLVEVEQLMQTTIPPSLLFETGTVRQLTKRLGLKERFTPKAAVRIGGNEGRLFHFFHGDFTHGGVSARRLTAPLGPRPTFAIAPHGMAGEQVPATIEEMAIDRLPVIQNAQPCGPYVLGGHCVGALVAFETARLLTSSGHRVDLVVMIDPIVVSLRRSARLLLLAEDLRKRSMGAPPEMRWRSLELAWEGLVSGECRLRQYFFELKTQIKRAGGFRQAASLSSRAKPFRVPDPEINSAYARAILAYRPSRLDVPILYLALKYSGGGWPNVSRKTELIDLPDVDHQLRGNAGAAVMDIVRSRLDALDELHTR